MELLLKDSLYNFRTADDLSTKEVSRLFAWWSEKTMSKDQPRLMAKSPDELKKSLYSLFVFSSSGEIAGVGGVFPCFDKTTSELISVYNRPLAEIGSVYVDIRHRSVGIGTTCVGLRLDYVEENNMTPIMITQDLLMTEAILKKSGIKKINLADYAEMKKAIEKMKCHCNGKKKDGEYCDKCPLEVRSLIGFERFKHYYHQ